MVPEQHDYFLARADKEIELANRAGNTAIAKVHFELAARYLDLAHGRAGEKPREETRAG